MKKSHELLGDLNSGEIMWTAMSVFAHESVHYLRAKQGIYKQEGWDKGLLEVERIEETTAAYYTNEFRVMANSWVSRFPEPDRTSTRYSQRTVYEYVDYETKKKYKWSVDVWTPCWSECK